MQNELRKVVLDELLTYYGPQNWWQSDNRIKDVVSMFLIQQTTSKNADAALQKLDTENLLGLDELLKIDVGELEELIHSAGFFRQKSQNIKKFFEWINGFESGFDDLKKVPTNELRRLLLEQRGVGPETADDMLLYIFDRKLFIADSYARRLFSDIEGVTYSSYNKMQAEFQPLADGASIATNRDWHAVIDVHSKLAKSGKQLDLKNIINVK